MWHTEAQKRSCVKFFLAIPILFFAGCAQRPLPQVSLRPDWLTAKPKSSLYYTGIGHSLKDGTSNHIQIAKKNALEDLVSEIKVTVSSTSVLSQIDVDNKFHERYEQIIQTEAAEEIEEFEMVDAWEDAFNYWVYYRLSKERYREIKEEQKRNAVQQAADFYSKGIEATRNRERLKALTFYFQALRAMEDYLADAVSVTIEGRSVLLTNEIYASIQDVLRNIEITVEPRSLEVHRRMNQNNEALIAHARFRDSETPIIGLPLRAAFMKGEGEVFPTYSTDANGNCRILLTRIGSAEVEQSVGISVDTETLAGTATSPIFTLITQSLRVPSDQVILRVRRPLVYLTGSERSFGRENPHLLISNTLKNYLTRQGFEFTQTRDSADLWFDVTTNTEEGSVAGSIFITYLNGTIRVSSAREGTEIYALTLDRIKGYGLDYDRSSIDAYNNTTESLEDGRLKDLINTILQ